MMKLTAILFTLCASASISMVTALPYGDSTLHYDNDDKGICKGHDWSVCKAPVHRRSDSDWKADDEYDWCKDYEHCNEYKDDDDKDDKYHKDFPFDFTSTLIAYAGPDQVINNNQTAVYGLPGGYGLFQFGLNSEQDVICYVCQVKPSLCTSVPL